MAETVLCFLTFNGWSLVIFAAGRPLAEPVQPPVGASAAAVPANAMSTPMPASMSTIDQVRIVPGRRPGRCRCTGSVVTRRTSGLHRSSRLPVIANATGSARVSNASNA